VVIPIDARCSDDSLCTAEACAPMSSDADRSGCVYRPVDCADDGDPCTLDRCDDDFGGCYPPAPPETPCEEVYACSIGDTCDGFGTCNPGFGAIACVDDGNPCTIDVCDEDWGGCGAPAPPGTDCDPLLLCTEGDHCNGSGDCIPGPVVMTCEDDGNPCTIDTCNESYGGCYGPAPFGADCDDFFACTFFDFCVDGSCTPGPIGVGCPPDGDPCTRDICDEDWGGCHPPVTECSAFRDGCCPRGCRREGDPDCG
jgi:hypothetical protein